MKVLVAGAGPAGSRISEILARNGIQVILVDKLTTPNRNIFSSAVLPIKSIQDHDIPLDSISTYWNAWNIVDPNGYKHKWVANSSLGVVLDFSKLRTYLWKRVEDLGVELLLGWTVKSVESFESSAEVTLIDSYGTIHNNNVDWVIDATGNKRSLIGCSYSQSRPTREEFLKGSGIEWIIQANSKVYKSWFNSVTFLLGTQFIPHGYGWIFPMANNQLKVGVCHLPPNNSNLFTSLSKSLYRMLQIYDLHDLKVLDRHGGLLSSTLKRRVPHIFGRIIGVGDAVSTANLLGGEGIRHALLSAEVLGQKLVDQLDNKNKHKSILKYQKALSHRLGWRWRASNRIAKRTWWGLNGQRADKRLVAIINGLDNVASAEELSALLFDYRFERYGFRLLPYLIGWR